MNSFPIHTINLDLSPSERWKFLENYKSEISELYDYYLHDFHGAESIIIAHIGLVKPHIPTEYLLEIEFLATILPYSKDQILLVNLYYDILKVYLGCTAFSLFDKKRSIMWHARNLDWHTENDLLSKHSATFNFQKNEKTIYNTIGWPGFIGALSGVKPGKFGITLNAVSSNDPVSLSTPVSFLIRHTLEHSNSFSDAVKILSETEIVSDCLLLVAGTNPEEQAVIERAPKRCAVRTPNNQQNQNFLVVTNDYKKLEIDDNKNTNNSSNILQSTSCHRYDSCTLELMLNNENENENHEFDSHRCLEILSDENIKMTITVQQMAFNVNSGEITLI